MKAKKNIRKKYDVAGLGVCCVDYLGLVSAFPRPNTKTGFEEFTRQGGGLTGTAIAALAKLGARTSFIGKLGDDEHGEFLINDYKKSGVDVKHTLIAKGEKTITAFIVVDKKTGSRTIFHTKLDSNRIKRSEINTDIIRQSRYLFVDTSDIQAALTVVKVARKFNVKTVVDAEHIKPGIRNLISLIDICFADENFCRKFTGSTNMKSAAEKLYSKMHGNGIAIVSMGRKGSILVSKDGTIKQPAFKVNVKDTTGAGDVFHGTFIYGMLQSWVFKKALEFASATAAIKCMELGGRAGIPTLKQVLAFINKKTR